MIPRTILFLFFTTFVNCQNKSSNKIYSLTFEYGSDKKRVDFRDGEIFIIEELDVRMNLYGDLLNNSRLIYTDSSYCGDDSKMRSKEMELTVHSPTHSTTMLRIPPSKTYPKIYFCLIHQNVYYKQSQYITVEPKPFPLWLHIILLALLLTLSGLFSGLNLGLMSLNKTDLKIITNTGTPSEREYATKIAPVRNHGNFLLCCLLFSNVLVNASLTILVDELTSGVIAIIMSTLCIVIFGEIIPQAICSRHGLAVGARTILVTKFFMFVTFPLAYPLSKILDKLLGEEIGSVYTRERLKELLRVTKDHHGLETEEVGIISGALDMKTKTVKDIMTSLDVVFMINIESNLDFDTLAEIDFQGYSRIPVFEGHRGNVVAVLNVKQLTLLDGSDNIPIKTIIEYYKNSLFYVFENTRLDYMFRAFREGNRGHMAFVQRVNDDGPGDPYYETVGVVTMEDVLEELLQAEIMDETDVGKYQSRLTHKQRPRDIPFNTNKKYKQVVQVQPQLALAAVQYLATNVEAFDRQLVSESIIQRLLSTSVFMDKPFKTGTSGSAGDKYLYRKGTDSDSFIMILDGKVEVQVGSELILFEAGPFHHFGASFLLKEFNDVQPDPPPSQPPLEAKKLHTFIPDYSVRIIEEVYYIKLKFSGYSAARQATDMERNFKDNVNWEDEIEKVLNAAVEEENVDKHAKRVQLAPEDPPSDRSTRGQSLPLLDRRRKSEPNQRSDAESDKLLK